MIEYFQNSRSCWEPTFICGEYQQWSEEGKITNCYPERIGWLILIDAGSEFSDQKSYLSTNYKSV